MIIQLSCSPNHDSFLFRAVHLYHNHEHYRLQYLDAGQPMGTILIAPFPGEPALIAAGYVQEQGTQARVEPDIEATMKLIDALTE